MCKLTLDSALHVCIFEVSFCEVMCIYEVAKVHRGEPSDPRADSFQI